MQSVGSTDTVQLPLARIGNALPDIILSDIDGEPRARDLDVAERLGFDRPRDIRKLIERNLVEIESFGVCATVARTPDDRGGRPATEYWLTEEQALLVASRSEAENAPQVRRMLIKVFVAWRRGHLTPTQALTPAEMFLQNAQTMVAIERQQAEHDRKIMVLDAKVEKVAQTQLLTSKPQNAETISEIRKRINRRYGLSKDIVDTVTSRMTYSPKPAGMLKNEREEAKGSTYAVYWIRDVTQAFKFFVDECRMATATQATHPHIDGRFKLTGKAGA